MEDPLDITVGEHWKNDPKGARDQARAWTSTYAIDWGKINVSCYRYL